VKKKIGSLTTNLRKHGIDGYIKLECTKIDEERVWQKNNTRRSFNFNSSDYGVKAAGCMDQESQHRVMWDELKRGIGVGSHGSRGGGSEMGSQKYNSQTSDGGSVWSL